MAKMTLTEQAQEILRIAEESGVQSNYFFITTFKRYQMQLVMLYELEKSIKKYIDGIVDSVVPNIIKSGLNPEDFNRALETLCDISYQQMEELR